MINVQLNLTLYFDTCFIVSKNHINQNKIIICTWTSNNETLNESKIIFLGHLYHKNSSKVFLHTSLIFLLNFEDQIGVFIFNLGYSISFIFIFFRFFSFLTLMFPFEILFFVVFLVLSEYVDGKLKHLTILTYLLSLRCPMVCVQMLQLQSIKRLWKDCRYTCFEHTTGKMLKIDFLGIFYLFMSQFVLFRNLV